MKARFFVALVLSACLALTLAWVAAAQGPEPVAPILSWDSGKPSPSPLASGDTGAQDATPAVALGQPGLSFRYVQTFGTTEVAYISDTAHINYPYGLAVDGANVWIADTSGLRALKYQSDGTFLMQIGRAGFREASGQSLDSVAQVGVDGGGNVWLVDSAVNHVLKFNSSGVYVSKLGQSWSWGSDSGRFNSPRGIAFDAGGNIYVSDANNHRIQVFTSGGVYSTTIGVTGVATKTIAGFNFPQHLTIDSSGYLYVADQNNHRVQVFDAGHAYVATIGFTGVATSTQAGFNSPTGVFVDASRIYVADRGNHRVQIFNRATRAYQSTIGTGVAGSANGQFNYPSDVAVDASGNIYVAEQSKNSRVQQFNSSGSYVRTYGATGVPYLTDNYHYNQPSGIAVAVDGSMYVVEGRGQRLLKLDAAGSSQWTIGLAGIPSGSDNAVFSYPNGVALDGAGKVYVADTGNNRIQVYNSNGVYAATLGTGKGTGPNQFNNPYGLTVGLTGTLYVADRYNHRVQVFDASLAYVDTLGVTGVAGSDDAHFNEPLDVAVDLAGNIYVVDRINSRVQVFNSSRSYVRTIGETGVAGSDFGRFSNPTAVAVDKAGRTYVSDQWGGRVQVFDNTGGYLTTVGGSTGNRTGQMRQVEGLAVDGAGVLYTAELLNHRIQKYAPGTPGWVQTSINGFGHPRNDRIGAMGVFSDALYAGAWNLGGGGAQLWRSTIGTDWSPVITNGFGITLNDGIAHLLAFDNQLFVATRSGANGGEIYRSSTGDTADWTRVVSLGFGNPVNMGIYRLATFNNQIYAGTGTLTDVKGIEIWRSSTGDATDWTRVVSNGFGMATNTTVRSSEVYSGHLYFGTNNWESVGNTTTGGQVWRSPSGDAGTWTQVNTGGFGDVNNSAVSALAAFNGYLYASTTRFSGTTGAQVWRCQACDGSDWFRVEDSGSGPASTASSNALEVLGGRLYFVGGNSTTGAGVWRTGNGVNWEQVGVIGLGDSNNLYPYWDSSVAVFSNRLYVGTYNYANGGEIWKKTVTAGFTASPVIGPPPLNVSFTNQSAGDVTTTLWDFGDGVTSVVISPTHEYSRTGVYTVTLTVGDGVDSNSLTRTALVQVLYRAFLPVVMRN